jgi:hypothetical protein
MTQVPITMRKNAKLFFRPFPALDPSPVIPSDLSFGYLSVELKSPVKIPILDMRDTGQSMVASGGLSPLLGALYLTPLDRRMDRLCKGKRLVHYVRYMDDIVLLARTRWELRRAIAALHEEIATLGLHLHRIKRFIGRTTDTPRRNVRHDSDCRMGPKGFVFEGVSNLRPHRLPPNHVSEFAEMSRLHQPRSRHPSDDVPRLKSNPLSNPRVRRSASHQ